MSTFQKALLTAVIKSLLRGKSLLQAILTYWVRPVIDYGHHRHQAPRERTLITVPMFLAEAEAALLGPVRGDGLVRLSEGLKKEYFDRLQNDAQCMLPSYSHQLPLGGEVGQYLCLDVGGSTLRVAVVELSGQAQCADRKSEILSIRNFPIGKSIKDLEGPAFFDWMAARILETIKAGPTRENGPSDPLPMALAWSFPIEQTSLGGGKLQYMGKGFKAEVGLTGQDLGEIVQSACLRQGFHVQLKAILNDSSACLLSRAYTHTTTRFGLILGTGFNMAAYLPVRALARAKFGIRPPGWFDEASHVIVNTELSMFGRKILPLTRWDHKLLNGHPRPDFQPMEYMVSGMYLGEIARFALIEAIETTGIFGGIVPPSLETPYALSSETLSRIQSDETMDLTPSIDLFAERHPSKYKPTKADIAVLKSVASFIAQRSAALIACCVYSLWDLRLESQMAYATSLPEDSQLRLEANADMQHDKTMVSFNGSVIENYPGYRRNCQHFINQLVNSNCNAERGAIELVPAKESSLLGAAVALACVEHR